MKKLRRHQVAAHDEEQIDYRRTKLTEERAGVESSAESEDGAGRNLNNDFQEDESDDSADGGATTKIGDEKTLAEKKRALEKAKEAEEEQKKNEDEQRRQDEQSKARLRRVHPDLTIHNTISDVTAKFNLSTPG